MDIYDGTKLETFGTKTILEFIQTDIKMHPSFKDTFPENYVEDIIEKEDYSSQGFYYERLWDLCFKFGLTPFTELPTFHIHENSNIKSIDFKPNGWTGEFDKYLRQKVRSGNSGGYSDITFLTKGDKEVLYFISVKYFQKEKDIAKYDIGKLCTLIRQHERPNREIKVYICVNNKKKVIEKMKAQHLSSKILIDYINPHGQFEHVLGSDDLEKYYFLLRKLLEQFDFLSNPSEFEKQLNINKKIFIPRFHQKLCITTIQRFIEENKKKIIVGAIPRSGKSYIMTGTILDYVRLHPEKKCIFLIMTPAPNETFSEYQYIFDNYLDFKKEGIDYQLLNDKKKRKTFSHHGVYIVSKQKLGYKEETDDADTEEDDEQIKRRIQEVMGDITLDIMFLDEAHFGMSTEKANKIISFLDRIDTVKVYVTATYNKPSSFYGVPSEDILTWSLEDIEAMKEQNPKRIQRFVTYDETVDYFGRIPYEDYSVFPKPFLFTTLWDKEFLNTEKLKIGDSEFGWDMDKLFSTNGSQFENENQVKEMMRYYFGYPDKTDHYDKQAFYRSRGILPRIKRTCINQCRTLQVQHATTQLWFLPLKGKGTILQKAEAIVQLFIHKAEFKDLNYHFYIAIENKKSHNNEHVTYLHNPHHIKQEIEEVERTLKQKGKDDLIILAGQRLQLGISLKNVDIVTLWNSTTSDDALFQMLFRSMTEVDVSPCNPDEYCNQKKYGFMVDMNPQRTMNTVQLFKSDAKHSKASEMEYIMDLINIDTDVLQENYEDKTGFAMEFYHKLTEEWTKHAESVKVMLRSLSFDMESLQRMKHIFIPIREVSDSKESDGFEPGKKQAREKQKEKKEKKEKEIDLLEMATTYISNILSLLNIITLYTDGCVLTKTKITTQDIIQLKENVFLTHKELFLQILNERMGTSLNEDIINDLLDTIQNDGTLNKIAQTQRKQYATIREPDKLLVLIHSHLKPNQKEKEELGEVFTPMELVHEMLEKLDKHYTTLHGKSIFTNPDLTWFDPAVGMGNFMVGVYLRLMKGLSIQPEEDRRKHILENMLFMSEIALKNIFILKKIFCSDNYTLNIHEGDTLVFDAWGKTFDIILGNPPYNKGGIKSHTGAHLSEKSETIWPKFIQKSLDWLKPDGFLVFINPLSWLKKSHSLHNDLLEKHIVWLKLWDNSQSKEMINADIPISLYILQNTMNINKKTEITSILKRRSLTSTSTVYLNPNETIPLAFHTIFDKLSQFIKQNDCALDYKTKTIKSSGIKTKIPTEYTLEDMWAVDTYTIKEGLMVKKATEQHPDANKQKLIISNKASFTGAFIDDGKLSLTGNHKFYILGDKLKLVKKILDFRIISIIGHYTKYGQDFLDNEAFNYIPDIRKLGMDVTEDEFYKLIGLTRQEINQINQIGTIQVEKKGYITIPKVGGTRRRKRNRRTLKK